MQNQQSKPYKQHFPWLKIFNPHPSQSISHSNYHYFSHDVQGYQKVSLSVQYPNKKVKKMKMYYEIDNQIPEPLVLEDTSTIRDFSYLDIKEPQTECQVINADRLISDSQWVMKYEPNRFVDLLTDEKANRELLSWLKSWDPIVFNKNHHNKIQTISAFVSPKKGLKYNSNTNNFRFNNNRYQQQQQQPLTHDKLILLSGPPGCGKSTLVRVLAHHCKYDVKEINASDDRSASTLIDKIQNFSTHETIKAGHKPSLICLDQIDGINENDSNGIKVILDYLQFGKKKKKDKNEEEKQNPGKGLKNKKKKQQQEEDDKGNSQKNKHTRPIIFICNDPFSRGLKQLRKRAHVFYFSQLSTDKVIRRLKQISGKQNANIETQILQKICKIGRNDIRSCVSLLELLCKQKMNLGKNPKQIINKMKLSFIKDNEANLSQFMSSILYKPKITQDKKIKQISNEVYEIGNPSLLIESMLQNMLYNKQMYHQFQRSLQLYNLLSYSDFLIKNSFKYRSQLDIFHHLPYTYYYMNYKNQQEKRIEFPLGFFQKLKKLNNNKDILSNIYSNLPLTIRDNIKKTDMMGPYLLSLFLSMQPPTTKEQQVVRCVSIMVTYGFTVKKDINAVFSPQIDSLLTFGKKKPQILVTNITKTLMQENYTFVKMRKDIVGSNELKDATQLLINQMNLQSRKRRKMVDGVQYKYQQGTGTKITFPLTFKHLI